MLKQVIALLVICVLVVGTGSMALADQAPDKPQTAFYWLSECEEDLSGETITFYHFGDLSAFYAPITLPLIAGLEDAITLMNENGGLCGAEVVQEYQDTANDQDTARTYWGDYSERDDAYSIFLYNSADGELLLPLAEESEIVLLNAAASELALYGEDGQPTWQYTVIPLYVDQLGAFCDYVAENWADMGIEGDPVIGHLSWGGAFGQSSDTEATRAYCEQAGVGYAGAEYIAPDTTDVSTQLQTLTDNGANIIYTTSLANGPAAISNNIAAMELPILKGGVNWALDTSVMFLGGPATDGIIGSVPYLWWDDTDEPGIQIITAYWAEHRFAVDPAAAGGIHNVAYITTFGLLDLWAEALIRTINRVGYDNLSGAALHETLQDFQYDPFLGVLHADYTDGNRAGRETRIGQIQFIEGESGVTPSVVPLTDWIPVPDLRVGGADVPE